MNRISNNGKREIIYAPNLFKPATLSDYFRPLRELKPGTLVVIVCRVSTRTQEHNKNLDDQERRVRRAVEQAGGVVIDPAWKYVGSGFDPFIDPAVWVALERGAVLVAETTDRFLRPEDYHSADNPNATLRNYHMNKFRYLTRGIPCFTVADPDATPGGNRGTQTRRGMEAKGNNGGRPRQSSRKLGRGDASRRGEGMEMIRHYERLGSQRIPRWVSRKMNVSIKTVYHWMAELGIFPTGAKGGRPRKGV